MGGSIRRPWARGIGVPSLSGLLGHPWDSLLTQGPRQGRGTLRGSGWEMARSLTPNLSWEHLLGAARPRAPLGDTQIVHVVEGYPWQQGPLCPEPAPGAPGTWSPARSPGGDVASHPAPGQEWAHPLVPSRTQRPGPESRPGRQRGGARTNSFRPCCVCDSITFCEPRLPGAMPSGHAPMSPPFALHVRTTP